MSASRNNLDSKRKHPSRTPWILGIYEEKLELDAVSCFKRRISNQEPEPVLRLQDYVVPKEITGMQSIIAGATGSQALTMGIRLCDADL